MSRLVLIAGLLALAAAPARAQVEVTTLAAPDAFSTPGRQTGLPQDLWRGTPIDTARAVLPLLASKPLSPAGAALARRVLATGAPGPAGSTGDEALTAGRADALTALGDVGAASAILERQAGLDRSADLAHAAAETALLTGRTDRACAVAEGLTVDRGDVYWLRLRAFCEADAGQNDQAQLTFDLAQAQAKDAIFARLLSAKLTGAAPGAPSLRNGLDYALSKSLGLDVTGAKASSEVAAAMLGAPPAEPGFDTSGIDADTGGLASALQSGPAPPGGVSALIAAAADASGKTKARLQGAALLVAALSTDLSGEDRAKLATYSIVEGKAPIGRDLAMESAAEARRMGETALLALWTCTEAGANGPALADRVRIVRALARAGLHADARAFALEGLAGLK